MSGWTADSAVALFIFNRPSTTEQVFNQIAEAEPPRLYVIADGPREDHPNDIQKCQSARKITDAVNWQCEVKRNYAKQNQGLKQRFVTGLEWLFDYESEAIILEDDCVPNLDFFKFCEVMLEEYRDDKRVWDISGSNHLESWKESHQDYHFSFNGGIWGWATWRRSWEQYDPEMDLWTDPEARARFRDVIADKSIITYLETIYGRTYDRDIETWDYPWGFSRQLNSGLSVVPARNLVSNVGFGENATNTTDTSSQMAAIPRDSLNFPLHIRDYVAVDREYDRAYFKMRTEPWERIPFLRRVTDKLLRSQSIK